MPKVYGQSPYGDDFDASRGYTKLLAVPGRSEQAREFTQIQSIFHEYIKRLGDVILKDGSIVEGCDLVITGKKATITSGKLYLGGLVRNVDGGIVDILGVGNETIGAVLDERIVTEIDDPSFRDPAQGFENFGQAGAHRVKETVRLVANEQNSSVMFRLYNGELVNEEVKPELDIVNDVLARRTFDESGNYKVTGLDLRNRNESDGQKIYLSLSEGKAYVKGYEVVKPSATKIELDYARETRQILNEPKTFNTGTNDYKLNNYPASQLTQVKCIVEVTETMTRGNIIGGIDYLSKTPVVDIKEITQGGVTYIKGVDFQLTNDAVDWSLPGKDPSPGTQYVVKWTYNKIMTVGTDVELIHAIENGETVSKIRFMTSGVKPVSNTQFDIDYRFYLARKDLVCIDSVGRVEIVKGKADLTRLVDTPLNKNDQLLSVASVLVHPNSSKVDIMNFAITAMSMEDLYKLVRRLEDTEYNQAVADLDREAIESENATDLKGIFTDGFKGFTKCDTAHSEFNIALDLDTSEITLPSTHGVTNMVPTGGTSKEVGSVITSPYTEVVGLHQPYASEVMLVNPYAVYDKMLLVKLTPSVDNWIESETITINKQVVKTENFRRWWKHQNDSWAEAERLKWQATFGNSQKDDWSNLGQNKSTTVEITKKKVLDEAIMHMRQTQLKVEGFNFLANQDNIECYFDGTKVPISAMSPSVAGTQNGTVRADGNGKVVGKITVPPNVPCGSVNVELKSPQGEGSTIYRAQGRNQVTEETVLTTTIVAKLTDPLAQSFVFEDKDTLLTSVALYFASKDTSAPLNIQVRNMINGYPGTICYSETVLLPSQVNVSSDGSLETRVVFDNPTLCKKGEQYCITVLSDSNLYSMFIATLGGIDLTTKSIINRQPYNTGVLFSSSNNTTWTAHQTQDLKFKLFVAKYTGDKGVILFNDVSNLTVNRLLLISATLNPDNTGVTWYYAINNGTWLPIETYVDRETTSLATKISLKAELEVKNGVSPLIAKNTINLISFMSKSAGAYVSKNVLFDEAFTKIKVSVEFAFPSGTTGKVFYSTDGNGNTWTELTSPQVTSIDTEFSRYDYSATVPSATNYRVKVVLETTNPLIRPRARKLINVLKY